MRHGWSSRRGRGRTVNATARSRERQRGLGRELPAPLLPTLYRSFGQRKEITTRNGEDQLVDRVAHDSTLAPRYLYTGLGSKRRDLRVRAPSPVRQPEP